MRLLLFLPFALFLIACGSQEVEEKTPRRTTAVVGEVTSVHPEQGFLLFRRYGGGEVLEEGVLSARSPDGKRAVGLTLSPEKLGRFYAADYEVAAGVPRVGDVVIRSRGLHDTENEEKLEKLPEAEEILPVSPLGSDVVPVEGDEEGVVLEGAE
ncbi:hypothetical protein [Roseibacillus ishigakijimensis]|nr:hypothetical protein [Roseibacillus ishigakijimensis]